MTATLQIQLFGGLRVALDGVLIRDFYSIKAPALLAYLAVTRRTPTRDALAALLWGEMSDVDAKTNLRQAFASLRKHLEPHLLITRDTAEFNFDTPYLLDVEQFETKFREENLSEAVALYKGDFLDGVFVRDAPEFEEWAIAQRARLRELALQAFHKLTQQHARRGEYARGIDYATCLLALDPWREETHRELMLMLARTGQRSVALQQYEICKRELRGQMGVEPSTETTALYERIRAAGEAMPNNLPSQPTSFVGRLREFAQIEAALLKPECRLITLLGAGGVGKTRLALQAAERALKIGAFLNGVYFVSLSDVDSPALLAPAMADAVGFTFSGKPDPQTQLANFLREKEMLFVLDNFEHLLDAATWLSQLLTSSPRLKILVTSRERLNLQREWLVVVEGLEYPNGAGIADAHQFTAVQLFVERARQVRPDFELNDATRAGVARVCQLVEGMPLGIELAAAWAQTHSADEIARAIEHGYDFLATTQRDAPEHQRSLRAVFDHSWTLLDPAARAVFAKLSVFRGGFTRQVGEQVARATRTILSALVDKSFLRSNASGRYEMHELLRQYAEEKLRQSAGSEEPRTAHADYFARWLEELGAWMRDERSREALAQIALEWTNVYAMWTRLCQQRDWQNLLTTTHPLYMFCDAVGRFHEGDRLLRVAEAALDESAPSLLRARVLNRRGSLLRRLGQLVEARQTFEMALLLARGDSSEDAAERANTHQHLGSLNYVQGNFTAAKESYSLALDAWRALHNDKREVGTLNALGATEAELDNPAQAREVFKSGIALAQRMNNVSGLAVLLDSLGLVERTENHLTEALRLHEESLVLHRQLGNPISELNTLINMGDLHYQRGELTQARQIHEDLLPRARALGGANQYLICILTTLGQIACDQERFAEARAMLQEALGSARATGSEMIILTVLNGIAHQLRAGGHPADSARLYEFVLQHPAADRFARADAQRALAQATAQPWLAKGGERLDAQARDALRHETGNLSMEQLVAGFLS